MIGTRFAVIPVILTALYSGSALAGTNCGREIDKLVINTLVDLVKGKPDRIEEMVHVWPKQVHGDHGIVKEYVKECAIGGENSKLLVVRYVDMPANPESADSDGNIGEEDNLEIHVKYKDPETGQWIITGFLDKKLDGIWYADKANGLFLMNSMTPVERKKANDEYMQHAIDALLFIMQQEISEPPELPGNTNQSQRFRP